MVMRGLSGSLVPVGNSRQDTSTLMLDCKT